MSGERVALLAFDQELHLRDTGNVGGNGLRKRSDRELLHQNTRRMRVNKGGIEIYDRQIWADYEDGPHVGTRRQRVSRTRGRTS